jgi:exonuclease VII small subunit
MRIQPAQFINENNLLFAEGNAIKYICRHKLKGKRKDIEKAIHYLEMILERDYDS